AEAVPRCGDQRRHVDRRRAQRDRRGGQRGARSGGLLMAARRGGVIGRRRENLTAWAFLLPGLIPLVAFLYWPLGHAFGLSFFQWNLLGEPRFVGTLQYERLLTSDTFRQSLYVTAVYTV